MSEYTSSSYVLWHWLNKEPRYNDVKVNQIDHLRHKGDEQMDQPKSQTGMMHNFLVVFHKNNSLPIGPINLHLILLKSSMSETIIWYHLVYSMQVHSFHFKHSILLRMTLWFAWQGIINLLTFKSQLRFQWSTSSLLPKRTVKCKQIVNI